MSQPVGEPLGEYGEYGVSVGSEDENKDEVALREAVTGLFGVEEGDVVELTGSVSVVVAERVSVIIRVVEGVLELEFVNNEELDAALLEDETPVLNVPDGTGGEYVVRVGTVEDSVELSEAVTGLFSVEDCATPVPGDVMVELARDEFGYTPLSEGLPLLSGAVGEDSEYGLETSVEDEEVEFGAVTGPFGVDEGEMTVLVKDMVEFKNWRELVPEMLEDPVELLAVTGLLGVEDGETPVPESVAVELENEMELDGGYCGYGAKLEIVEVLLVAVKGPFGVEECDVTVIWIVVVDLTYDKELEPEPISDPERDAPGEQG
ncbi:hypothetical protein LTR66_017737 [Elasticomyces elasticus]|nr:hypothetical protein LTR66_017737 [Elasticomyces elasticus]